MLSFIINTQEKGIQFFSWNSETDSSKFQENLENIFPTISMQQAKILELHKVVLLYQIYSLYIFLHFRKHSWYHVPSWWKDSTGFWGVICLLYFYICYLIIMWAIFPSHSSDCWDFFKTFYWNHFTFQVLHYVEKPETFVSSIINCGVYLFTPTIFNHIKEGFEKLQNEMRSACLRLIIR